MGTVYIIQGGNTRASTVHVHVNSREITVPHRNMGLLFRCVKQLFEFASERKK